MNNKLINEFDRENAYYGVARNRIINIRESRTRFSFFFFFFGECKQIKKSEKPFSKQRKQVEIV